MTRPVTQQYFEVYFRNEMCLGKGPTMEDAVRDVRECTNLDIASGESFEQPVPDPVTMLVRERNKDWVRVTA